MWYVAIFALVGLTFVSYRKKKLAARFPEDIKTAADAILANDATVICLASLALVMVILLIHGLAPGGTKYKMIETEKELRAYRVMGQYLAQQATLGMKKGAKTLVIGRADNPTHKAMVEGLKAGLPAGAEIVKQHFLAPNTVKAEEAEAAAKLGFTAAALDELIEKNEKCTLVFSFASVPLDYWQSKTFDLARSGKIRLAIYTDNVYSLGGPIIEKGITTCAFPRPGRLPDEGPTGPEDLKTAFSKRYVCVDHKSVMEVARQNKRLFHLIKQM